MLLRWLQSRQVLGTIGMLALLYGIVVLADVATSPDIRIRCLLFDSELPSGLPEDARGVIMRRVDLGDDAVPANCVVPSDGDVLTRVAGRRVLSFFDFSRNVAGLRWSQLKTNGQLAEGARLSDHMATLPGLVQDASRQRWVLLEFYSQTSGSESSNGQPDEAVSWERRKTFVRVQDIPTAEIVLSLVWFLLQLAVFAVGALAVWRRPDDGLAVLFFAMCVVTVVAFVGGFHWWLVVGSPWLTAPFVASAVLLPVISLHFFLAYPRPSFLLSSHRNGTLWTGYTISAVAGLSMLVVLEMARWSSRTGVDDRAKLESMTAWLGVMRVLIDLFLAFAGFCFVALLVALFHNRRTTRHPIEKNQLDWLFWAGLLAGVPVCYTLRLALSSDNDHRVEFALGWSTRLSMFLASLAFLCAYAVGIIRYKLMLIDELVSRGVMYYLARVILAVGFGVSVSTVLLILERLAHPQAAPPGAQRVLALGTILVVIALILQWLRGRIQQAIDRKFFREKYRLHTAMERINQAVVRVGDPQSLADRMLGSCHDVFQVRSAAIYLLDTPPNSFRLAAVRGTPEQELPLEVTLQDVSLEQLHTHSHILGPRQGGSPGESGVAWPLMQDLSAELLYGLELDGHIGVLVALGSKPDETTYSAEDLTFLGALGQITTVALHSARVHRDVTRLNDELRDKVETIGEQERRIAVMQARLAESDLPSTQNSSIGTSRNPRQTTAAGSEQSFHREPIIGSSPALARVLQTVRKVAGSEASVLLQGPSGTGKELLAQALHDNSPRRDGPLVRVHSAALSPSLLESELFGHVKGAFTGAHRDRIGRFEMANSGTLFLDEIGDISLETQVKLLRVLQTRAFEPVGGTRTVDVDVRLITATHQDLKALIKTGQFREDLYYRLNVICIELPGLVQRREDIVELAVHFLKRSTSRLGKPFRDIDESAVAALLNYDWPGNVRELENAIERAVVLSENDTIQLTDFPEEVQSAAHRPAVTPSAIPAPDNPITRSTDAGNERDRLIRALEESGGNKARAARSLGIPRSTFFSQLKKHQLD